MNRFGKLALFASLATALLTGAGARAADGSVAVEKIAVFYGDLNLARPAGAEALLHRINAAAALACGGQPDPRNITAVDHFLGCTRMATDSAILRLGNTRVSALYGQEPVQVATAR